jgi:benzaldehyde dehydrogenase (NAD)
VLQEAGLPEGVLHLVTGGAKVGKALVQDSRVRVISFPGSTAAGRTVGEAAARNLKRAHLELGGNSALIVLDDVDLDLAVSAGAFGSFTHQGQVCMTTGRHLVHSGIVDDYVEKLAAKAEHIPVGNRSPNRSRSDRSSTRPSATRSTTWSRASTAAPPSRPAAPTRGCSTARRC